MWRKFPDEFRFTARRLSILVASFALIVGVLVPLVRRLGEAGYINPTIAVLLLSPWILGSLVLALDHRGPVKYWAAPLLLSLIAPGLAVGQDWIAIQDWVRDGTVRGAVGTLLLNLLLIGAFTLYLAAMSPKRCPKCGRWTLIPLLNIRGKGPRTTNTRWCGGCGSTYWRTHGGEDWKVERRRTWLEGEGGENAAKPVGPKGPIRETRRQPR